MPTEAPPTTRAQGCGLALLGMVAVLLVAVGWLWQSRQHALTEAQAAQALAAQEAFQPVLGKMEQGIADPGYDIDKTIRVIHEVDQALNNQATLNDYLAQLAMQDYRDVAPEVLEARKALLDIQMDLYAKQVEADDQQAMWELTSELLLSTMSVVSVSGEANLLTPSGEFSVDRGKAQDLLTDLKERKAQHKQLMKDITATEQQLFEALFTYSEVYYTYVEEWDQLSVLRDRAYLAAHNGDWPAALASAELAMAQAPHEREAHLLAALARIEMGNEDVATTAQLLEDYIAEHPDSSAPAFLLQGVLNQRLGRDKEALLAFQQSAAYYPKQADQLTDMLDPYRMRSFLNRSREGGFIVELYESTMLGAGYFSPDLQMARMLYDNGDEASARAKVLDHFARRRTQQQWDFILSDIRFCQDILGPRFWEIFPEDTYLDLAVSPTLMGSGLTLQVENRSPRTLHNATLILALHFTDMYPNDYVAMAAEQTVPAVLGNDTTSFGSVEIAHDINGTQKTSTDIVHHRAILVSNEAVVWVDTDAYRVAEAEEFRERRRTQQGAGKPAIAHPAATRHPEFQTRVDQLLAGAAQAAHLEVESRYGADSVLVELPRELAILRPLFRLRHGDEVFSASDNLIEGDHISLRFNGVHNFDEGGGGDLELLMWGPFGDVVLSWQPGADLTWRFEGLRSSDTGH